MDEPSELPQQQIGPTDVPPATSPMESSAQIYASPAQQPGSDVSLREICSVILLIILADITIYNGFGFSGYAVLLAVAPFFIGLGARKQRINWQTVIVTLLAWGAAVRLWWCGNELAFALGLALLGCVSISLASGTIFLLDVLRFIGLLVPAGGTGFKAYDACLKTTVRRWIGVPTFTRLLMVLMPLVAGLTFMTIFILANPDVVNVISQELAQLATSLQNWISQLVGSPMRIPFWFAIAWVSIGLLRPLIPAKSRGESWSDQPPTGAAETDLYFAFRNTIQVLIALFAVYLGFEFWTMWFRKFPAKFHYSGYAHEGAAWLTLALALATLMLSAIFRGRTMYDPRMPFLRRLAMVWAVENVVLALSVYNRLSIYIGFNGMTRMRVVGLLGISAVVAGFALVVIKMWRAHNFAWVVRNQMMVVAMAFYLYAVLPVDHWVMSYNVRQIMSGNVRPSVQISHHPTSTEGLLVLFPLLQCPDQIVRDGVAELLVQSADELNNHRSLHWTAYQRANANFLFAAFDGPPENRVTSLTFPQGAAERFKEYSYQWW